MGYVSVEAAQSELEAAFLRFCARHGVPRPVMNTLVEGLLVAGWRVVRLTWARLRDEPEVVARQLGALLCSPGDGNGRRGCTERGATGP